MRARRLSFPSGPTPRRKSWALVYLCLLLISSTPDRLHGLSGGRANAFQPHGPGAAATASKDGVKEIVPDKYLKKYSRWKSEYLSTEAGRRQWGRYAGDENFSLTITVSPELGGGGVVGGYRWDVSGRLVAATINLGSDLEGGALSPFYYPVTSALAPANEPERVSGQLLAAAKMAHEFGHINRAAEADAAVYQLQNELMASYAKIFEDSRYNAKDPRLLELARRLGGTPSEIKKGREHGAEANTLIFLKERLSGEQGDAALFRVIRKSIKEYANGHL